MLAVMSRRWMTPAAHLVSQDEGEDKVEDDFDEGGDDDG